MEKLVSIITPCYNGEKFVRRFLDSVLNQTYKNIELVFVNDGSIDRTEEIIGEYTSLFDRQGKKLKYIYQENAGQSAALDRGLKVFEGEYLAWVDSDDYLDPFSIEKRVCFLESNPQYGFVRSNAYYADFYTLKKLKKVTLSSNRFETRIFEGLLNGTQHCLNGCYLVRSSAFLEVNPDRTIEISVLGQNMQMLLPISYKYLCGYIDECLFYYVNTPDSHSKVKRNYQQACQWFDIYYQLLFSICSKIQMTDLERCKYNQMIEDCHFLTSLDLTLQYNQFEEFRKYERLYCQKYAAGLRCILPPVLVFNWFKWKNRIVLKCKNWIKLYIIR